MKNIHITAKNISAFFVIFSLALFATPAEAAEIQVYAAASLTDVLKEIAAVYDQLSRDKTVFNFAASSLLARQIQEGAPADLFISADEEKMDSLEKKSLIIKETRRSLLSNSLVIVVENDSALFLNSPKELADSKIKRIALAEPQTVPAGIYAKKYLQQIGIWHAVIDRLIPTENVRAALSAVEYGNAGAGIVYKTDAAISKKVKIVYEVPPGEGPKISYSFAVVKDSKNRKAVEKLLQYLSSPEGISFFKKYGFIIPSESV